MQNCKNTIKILNKNKFIVQETETWKTLEELYFLF